MFPGFHRWESIKPVAKEELKAQLWVGKKQITKTPPESKVNTFDRAHVHTNIAMALIPGQPDSEKGPAHKDTRATSGAQ